MKKSTLKKIFDIAITLINIACVIFCGSEASNLISL